MSDKVEKKRQQDAIELDVEKKPLPKSGNTDDDEYDYITQPPDGGFGWVVLIACFVSNFFQLSFVKTPLLTFFLL